MTYDEAGEMLRQMYLSAPIGEQAAHVHLFGIKYADRLGGLSNPEIVRRSGLASSYATKVNKGLNLAKYVVLKTDLD